MALTPKQEKFTQEWITTGNKSEAYRRAYSCENMAEDTINNKAYQLSNKGEIRARYEELTKAAQKRTETTQDTIDKMLKSAWTMAKDLKQPSSMVSAANGLAKLHGLIIDKNETKQVGDGVIINRRRQSDAKS